MRARTSRWHKRSDSTAVDRSVCFEASAMTTPAAMLTQADKARVFRSLHERDGAFIIPNPWDVGTARLLAHLGFEALATTSMGYAFSIGRRDNSLDRQEMIALVRDIVSATDLPVSAD